MRGPKGQLAALPWNRGLAARACAHPAAGGEDVETPHRRDAVSTAMIEQRVSVVEAELKHLATKADLLALETRLTRWIAGLGFGVVGTLIAVLVDRFAG